MCVVTEQTTIRDRRRAEHSDMTAAQRSQRARLAALSRWSREDGRPQGEVGQAGLTARFEREVDPEGLLDPETLAKRVNAARRAHFTRLAMKRHNTK